MNPTLAGSAGIIQSSFGSTRGVNHVELEPSTSSTIYVAAFPQNNALPAQHQRRRMALHGRWRDLDSDQDSLNATQNTDRAEFAVTTLGKRQHADVCGRRQRRATRGNRARFYRTDDAVTATNASFTDMTKNDVTTRSDRLLHERSAGTTTWFTRRPASPTWSISVVRTPTVPTALRQTAARFCVRQTPARSFTDMTWDATTNPTPPDTCCQPNAVAPNGKHPDSHAIVEIPGTDSAIFGTDGGLMRSSGDFADI